LQKDHSYRRRPVYTDSENALVCGRVVILFIYNLGLLLALAVGAPLWLLRRRWREGLRERLGAGAARVGHALAGRQQVWVHAGAGLGGDFHDNANRAATGARALRLCALFLFPDRSAVGGARGFSGAAAACAGVGGE
jgi:hypothetical protein